MRIVHVIETLKAGGKERQLLELTRGLHAIGIRSDIVVQTDAIEYDIEDIRQNVHVIARASRWDLSLIGKTRAYIDQARPDVVHSWGTMPSLYAVPATRFGKVPFIAGHIRDAPSNMSRFDKRWWHGKASEPFAAAIVANSRAGLAAYRVGGSKAHVVYNGFDFSRRLAAADPQFRASLGVDTEHAVGMVARFGAHKDYSTFFKAAELICAYRDDVSFVAVGDGPGLLAYQDRYRDHPRIRVLGRRGDVERIVANLSIGVLVTSIGSHGEGISNALTEFLAAGRPVIATDDGGNRELVGSFECGLLIPPSDPDALVAAIESLVDDDERSAALGARGALAVRDVFSRERMVQGWLNVYNRVISDRRSSLASTKRVVR